MVNGEKTFITSGMRADFYTVAVRTGGPGASGVSLLLIEREREGFTRTPLKKMGWWCSDTATLHFDNVRVPAGNLIGEENAGFRIIMHNFNAERLGMAAAAVGFAQACLDEAVDMGARAQDLRQAPDRAPGGAPQAGRDADARRMRRARSSTTPAGSSSRRPRDPAFIAQLAMTKNLAARAMQFCADEAVQTLGGAGFMRGTRSERIYREAKVFAIGGGAEEIMKDLAAKQLGW